MNGEAIGIVADIQRAARHDGAGVRTTVFLKGCPLKCAWCHNPECIEPEPQTLFYREKCIGCGKCESGCYAGARVVCGEKMTVGEVLARILPDKPYYKIDGGVTLSGGEPLMQEAFAAAILAACRAERIGTAVETSLIYFRKNVFTLADFIMADFKIWDEAEHFRYTGVTNREIKSNFMKLDRLGIPIIARTPVIPGVEQGIPQISAFLKTLDNVVRYELLPYHPLGVGKAEALGKQQTRFEIPSHERIEELQQYAYIR